MKSNKSVITIDGPSASGKGTLAKRISKHLSASYLDTGLLYRLLAHFLITEKIENYSKKQIKHLSSLIDITHINDLNLNNEEIAAKSSIIAKDKYVRELLFVIQRDFIKSSTKNNKYIVLDGRDTGTTIYPEAYYKFFITCRISIRAERRYQQLKKNNSKDIKYRKILKQLEERDLNDKTRAISPLVKPKNAIEIDNSFLTEEETFNAALKHLIF